MKHIIIAILFIASMAMAGKFFSDLTVQGDLTVTGQIDVDNLRLSDNSLISTDTDGDVNLSPDGTGTVVVNTDLDVDNLNLNGNTIISTDTNGNIILDANGTGVTNIADILDLDLETNFGQISTPANPAASHNKLYFKTDDMLYSLNNSGVEELVGAGAGGTGTGSLNILDNSNANLNVENWTGVNGTLSRETSSNIEGDGSFKLITDAGSSAAQANADSVALPTVLLGKTCLIKIQYTTTYAAFDLIVFDGSVEILSETLPINVSPQSQDKTFSFVCPESGSLVYRIEDPVNSAANTIIWDISYLGEDDITVEISQANLVARAHYVGTTNCIPSRTNTALGAFPTDGDCPSITTDFVVSPMTIDNTDDDLMTLKLDNMSPGKYYVHATFDGDSTTIGAQADFEISDGSTTDGRVGCVAATSNSCSFPLSGVFEYTTSQATRTFEIFGSASVGTARILNHSTGNRRLVFTVWRYPLENELAIRADQFDFGWTSSTCTSDWVTNTTVTCLIRRVGEELYVRLLLETAGAPNSTQLLLDLPSGLVIDTDKILGEVTAQIPMFGSGIARNAGVLSYPVDIVYESTTQVKVRVRNHTGDATHVAHGGTGITQPFTWGSGDDLTVEFNVPIVGWENTNRAHQLVNTVIDPRNGVTQICTGLITNSGSPTITRSDGNCFASLVDNGDGDVTVNFASGTFGDIPNCTCAAVGVGDKCSIDPATAGTANLIRISTTDSAALAVDVNFTVDCKGPK